ncbi:hypothetical protein Vadar_030036 [Vaccinium darrowii]|uniref:Uncharacterized protein n=1 Tax=Vaccinium darrowii TaxID=229202 RepID=A0ACB7Y2Q8_9ERIC|nr:hypothetical protein Vadar_030036 [Vaccinium darrowii]
MVLRKWDASKTLEEIDFSFSPFWVQIHGLPLGYLNVKSGEKIAPLLDELVRIEDPEKEGRISRCLRIRNLNKPLKKGFSLKRPNDDDLWVKFQYERLADFCYGCGKATENFRLSGDENQHDGWSNGKSYDDVHGNNDKPFAEGYL